MLTYDDDGEWIGESLQSGNLTFACDGSYMEKLDSERCSSAFVLRCKLTGEIVRGTVVEKRKRASNYRGELDGCNGCTLVAESSDCDASRV